MRGTKCRGGTSGEDEDPGTKGSGRQFPGQIGFELGLQAWAQPPGLRHMLGRGARWMSKALETWGVGGIKCGGPGEGGGGLRDRMETAHRVCQAEDPGLHSPYTRDPLKASGPHVRRNKPNIQRENGKRRTCLGEILEVKMTGLDE